MTDGLTWATVEEAGGIKEDIEGEETGAGGGTDAEGGTGAGGGTDTGGGTGAREDLPLTLRTIVVRGR